MEKRIRLNQTAEIQRVRRNGKSWPHPLFVLIVLSEGDQEIPKIGVIATKSVGGAVERNHAKRLLRAAVDALTPHIKSETMILLVARRRIIESNSDEVQSALKTVLDKAHLYC